MRIWLNHWFSTAYRLIENARTDLARVFPNKKIAKLPLSVYHFFIVFVIILWYFITKATITGG